MNLIQTNLLLPCAERTLDVFVIRPPSERRHATALLVAGSKNAASVWQAWGKRIAEHGIAVVGVAQPGFGRSQGPWDFAGAPTRAALDALLTWVRSQAWVDPERIGFGGYSSGATNAFLLAARYGQAAALVGAAGIYDLQRWIHSTDHHFIGEALTALGNETDAAALAERSPVLVAARIQCPVRLVHGGKDEIVPVEQAQLMAAALRAVGNAPELSIFPERGHSALTSPAFVDFLVEWLAEE